MAYAAKNNATAFKQQRLKAWHPLLSPGAVIPAFLALGVVCIAIGAVILAASSRVVEIEARYDLLPCLNGTELVKMDNGTTHNQTTNCVKNITLTIPARMTPPIFFYYKLTNFYQNHRQYVKSRSDEQLHGEDKPDLSSCEPKKDGYPCGLIAWSMFNDTFGVNVGTSSSDRYIELDRDGAVVPLSGDDWTESDIAWKSDRDFKFRQRNDWGLPNQTVTHKSLTDSEFLVWMRTAALPTFKKLHRRITRRTLEPGDVLRVQIHDVFPVSAWSGEKAVVLTTTNWAGGKNTFLGNVYCITGAITLLLGLGFALKHRATKRKILGDPAHMEKKA